MSKTFRFVVPAALLVLAIGAGCGEVTKIQECTAIIEAVNKGQTVFKEIGDDPKQFEGHAKKVEDFEKAIGDVKVTDPELKKHVEEYRTMVTDMAKVLRDAAKGDLTVEKRIDKIAATEDELVNKINGYCNRQ